MTLNSDLQMPGAFHAEGFYRPPETTTAPTSAASSGFLPGSSRSRTNAMPTRDDWGNTIKRKRFHDDYSARIRDENNDVNTQSAASTAAAASLHPSAPIALPPHGTGSYILAGQIESPSAGPYIDNDMLGESMFSDSDYRRMLGTKRPLNEIDPNESHFGPRPLAQQSQQQPASALSWGAYAASTLNGVVGRIWQFCKAGSFKGFHAGGGRGYDLSPSVDDISMLEENEVDRQPGDYFYNDAGSVPGHYPKFSGEWSEKMAAAQEEAGENHSRASTPTAPAPKRRQMAATDDLGKNWVMVKDPTSISRSRPGTPDARSKRTTGSLLPTPRNRNHAPAVTTGRRISTPASRRSLGPRSSMASTPTIGNDRPTSSASFASQRSPTPTPTKTTAATATASFSTPKFAQSPRRHRNTASFSATPSHQRPLHGGNSSLAAGIRTPSHRRSQSGASVASSRGGRGENVLESSPRLDLEAKKLAARRKRDDDYNDVRMNAFNKTLQDMIRQGQEALATKVAVEGEGVWEEAD